MEVIFDIITMKRISDVQNITTKSTQNVVAQDAFP
jgi:hypothetical protein